MTKKNKKIKVIVDRFCHVSETFEIEAANNEEARKKAEKLSGDKKYSVEEMQLEDVISCVDE